MAGAKVSINGTTIMDISDTTANAEDVGGNKVFYNAAGVRTVGTGSGYVLKSGDTMTGNLTTKYSTWDVTTNPSENKNTDVSYVYDGNNKGITFHRVHHYANGEMGYEWGMRRQGSATTTDTLWNVMGLWVANDGTRRVSVSDSAAWRTALELGTSGALPITIAQGGTGNTTGTATKATTTQDVSNVLYPLGVTSGDTTALKRDTNIYMVNSEIRCRTSLADKDTTPSSNQYLPGVILRDSADAMRGFYRLIAQTDGKQGVQIATVRNNLQNGFSLRVDSSGTRTVGFDDPEAWRTGMDAAQKSTLGSFSNTSQTTDLSISNDNCTKLAQHSISAANAGTYLLIGKVEFATNSAGYRFLCISTTSGSANAVNRWAECRTAACSGGKTCLSCATIVTTSAITTYYLNVQQTSGSSLNAQGGILAIRLK